MSQLTRYREWTDPAALAQLLERLAAKYRRDRGLGQGGSLSRELAEELLESIGYTLTLSGQGTGSLLDQWKAGQVVLLKKQDTARELFARVCAAAPAWQPEGRLEELDTLKHFLERYDPVCLAHHAPEATVYPYLVAPPEVQGIDLAIGRLRLLTLENQILSRFPEEKLERFWDVFCARDLALTENPCGVLLTTAAAIRFLGGSSENYLLTPNQKEAADGQDLSAALTSLLGEMDLSAEAARYGAYALSKNGNAYPGSLLIGF